jgi:hypothetical protein
MPKVLNYLPSALVTAASKAAPRKSLPMMLPWPSSRNVAGMEFWHFLVSFVFVDD